MRLLTSLLAGLLFGLGMAISGMVDPARVIAFLDLAGDWDPSLAFVIVAAIGVMFVAVRIGRRQPAPLFDTRFHEPEFKRIDAPLVVGSALFGIGWGMSGICPGPAISLIAFWPSNLLLYLVALFLGSYAGALVVPSGRDRRLAAAS